MVNTRTIIVVWSWASSGIGEGDWQVAGMSYTNDKVICRDWPESPASMRALKALLKTCAAEGEVMLFLHRHHGYHQDHLRELIHLRTPGEDHGLLQIFLFGEGADAIYLTTDPRGLLGTSGTFSANMVFDGQAMEATSIADRKRREIKSTHFDYVWQLYKLALRRRIFELKEDFFNCLGQYLPQTQFESGELYDVLRLPENRQLFLRLLSFVGRIRKRSDLAKEIRTFERNTNRTLTFDDCGIQLETSYGVSAAEQYALLAAYVLRHVLARGETVFLPDLREKFEELLLQIPGLTYYS